MTGPPLGGKEAGAFLSFYFTSLLHTNHHKPHFSLFQIFLFLIPLFFLFTLLTLCRGPLPLLARMPFFTYIAIRGHGETGGIFCVGVEEDGRKGEKRDGGVQKIP